MHFDGKRIEHIIQKDLIDIVGTKEDQWLEFKQAGYKNGKDPAFEICKDVTAMANAEGGYILIGVREQDSVAQGFHSVQNADREVEAIKAHCDKIEPRVARLEVRDRDVRFQGEQRRLVIVHVPPSNARPHGFRWNDTTVFVRREDDHVRRFPIIELADAFAERQPPAWVRSLMSRGQDRETSPDDHALEETDPKRLIDLMRTRHLDTIRNEAYYRIFLVPDTLRPDCVDTNDETILKTLRTPAVVRAHGFGYQGLLQLRPSAEGLVGENGDLRVILQRNGYFELRCRILGHHFQWRTNQHSFDGHWLYPYAVCEYPVSFLRVARQIVSSVGIDGDLFLKQEYNNIKGFVLPAGHPSGIRFSGLEEWMHEMSENHVRGRLRTISNEFLPDQTALDLVKEVYAAFGYRDEVIPLFDEEGNFTP